MSSSGAGGGAVGFVARGALAVEAAAAAEVAAEEEIERAFEVIDEQLEASRLCYVWIPLDVCLISCGALLYLVYLLIVRRRCCSSWDQSSSFVEFFVVAASFRARRKD